jgi:hypothetical protein
VIAIDTEFFMNVSSIKATCVLRTILEKEKIIVIHLEIVGTKVAGEL